MNNNAASSYTPGFEPSHTGSANHIAQSNPDQSIFHEIAAGRITHYNAPQQPLAFNMDQPTNDNIASLVKESVAQSNTIARLAEISQKTLAATADNASKHLSEIALRFADMAKEHVARATADADARLESSLKAMAAQHEVILLKVSVELAYAKSQAVQMASAPVAAPIAAPSDAPSSTVAKPTAKTAPAKRKADGPPAEEVAPKKPSLDTFVFTSDLLKELKTTAGVLVKDNLSVGTLLSHFMESKVGSKWKHDATAKKIVEDKFLAMIEVVRKEKAAETVSCAAIESANDSMIEDDLEQGKKKETSKKEVDPKKEELNRKRRQREQAARERKRADELEAEKQRTAKIDADRNATKRRERAERDAKMREEQERQVLSDKDEAPELLQNTASSDEEEKDYEPED